MNYQIEYFNPRVLASIEAWPVELLMAHGPNLRMPHSRSMGEGLFELRPRGREGIGRAFYCYLIGKRICIMHSFIKKTEATPERELMVARKRVKELKNG